MMLNDHHHPYIQSTTVLCDTMVLCVVIGCSKCSGRDKDVSFSRIPKVITHRGKQEYELTKKRRDGFHAAISRDGLTDSKVLTNDRICSRHFTSGKPAYLYDETNPDWLPTLHLGHRKNRPTEEATQRWERKKARRERVEAAQCLLLLSDTSTVEPVPDLGEAEQEGVATQTDLTRASLQDMQEQLDRCHQVINDLTVRVSSTVATFSEESFSNNETVKFYTGLPNLNVLKAVFDMVKKFMPSSDVTKLSSFQEFIATMVKLRLNSEVQDLAYRLNISPATVSRILLKWLTAMDNSLRSLIMWPDHKALCKTMPECFHTSFGTKVAVIIDCFEIFIERPSNLQARAYTWSSYKHYNTMSVTGDHPTRSGIVCF